MNTLKSQQLHMRLNELQAEIEMVRHEIDRQTVPDSWVPEDYEDQAHNLYLDEQDQLFAGMEYPTHEDALRAGEDVTFYLRMRKFAFEKNNGWVPDWSNSQEIKHTIHCDHAGAQPEYVTSAADCVRRPGVVYFKHEHHAQELANLLNDGRI